jgi:UDP-glucose 4-epimerase
VIGAAEALRGRRVLVLGVTGFIGRWVARAATEAGARVWMSARDVDAARTITAAYGITGTVAGVDVLRDGELAAFMREVRPEVTFNLIGYGVDRRETDVALADAINVDLVRRVIALVREVVDPHGWPGLQLVHTGSALEYGAIGGHLSEDVAVNPTTVYGRTKLTATQLVAGAAASGVRAVTARLFTVYGPGEHEGRLLPSVLAARTATAPIPMTNGLQQRDFTWVGDVAEGLVRAAVQTSAPWPTVNLATGRLQTVRAFVADAERALGLAPGRFQFGALPTRAEEMAHGAVTVERVRQWLGWVPPTQIHEGVAATAAFIDRQPALPS